MYGAFGCFRAGLIPVGVCTYHCLLKFLTCTYGLIRASLSCVQVPLHPRLPNVPLRTLSPKRVRIVTLGPSSHARTRPHAPESPPMHARTSTPVPLSHARTTPSAPVPLTRARTEGLLISGPHLRGVKSPTRSCNPNFTREKMEGRSENLRILS